jgi:cytochrome c-type biogenesis protein CcmF
VIAFLGYGGILVALGSAVWLAVQGLRAQRDPQRVGRLQLSGPVVGLLGGAAVAMAALEMGLLADDFSIEYVARHHARATPLLYTIATGWAALEGSIVLWGLVLAGYTYVVYRRVEDGDRLGTGALAVMAMVAVFFFALMATVANPFRLLEVAPPDGPGPNPLLQNHILMAIHPPILYLGFVGFTVPFAFAISALLMGDDRGRWLHRTRRAALVAWTFLTAGIALGAWWSYEVLGWGGFWAWDPVENASFIPWLVGTAFIHSSVVQTRRGMLQAWNVALVISTFALTILGTFLTRSGVVASVHSFTQSLIGPLFLAFLLVVVVGSFGLFALRAHLVVSSPRLESLAGREGVFLFNNLLLAVFAFTVLTGTIYPILVEAWSGAQLSVGRPFFDRTAVPLSFALLLAMGVGPVTPYGRARPEVVWERVRTPLRIALGAGAVLVLAGVRVPYVVLTVMLATFVVATLGRALWVASARSPVLRVLRSDPGYWGGQISHVGVVLVAVAIALSGNLASRETATLAPGQSTSFAGYRLTYQAPFFRQEPNRAVTGARVELQRGGRVVAVLEPRFNEYPSQVQPVSTPAVHTDWRGDVYLSLRSFSSEQVTFSLHAFPLMYLLWTGGLIAAAGGAWGWLGGRRERAPAPELERV